MVEQDFQIRPIFRNSLLNFHNYECEIPRQRDRNKEMKTNQRYQIFDSQPIV